MASNWATFGNILAHFYSKIWSHCGADIIPHLLLLKCFMFASINEMK